MFKESRTEKIVEEILSLPLSERKTIVARIAKDKKKSVVVRNSKTDKVVQRPSSEFDKMRKHLDGLKSKLPKNYKFNREEANER